MESKKKISIVIPVYNEKGTLKTLLEKIDKVNFPSGFTAEVIVVDDGSNDGTTDLISALPEKYIKILKQKNQGKSAALRTGFEKATGEYVVVQDADLEYDPQDLAKMLSRMLEKNLNVLYGSRTRNMPNVKTSGAIFFLGGMSLSLLANLLYFQRITDEATCYKMFKKSFLDTLPLRSMRFEFCPEVTALTSKKGETIPEVPIMYYPRSVEEGKKIRMKDFFEAVWTLVSLRFYTAKIVGLKQGIDLKHNFEGKDERKHSFGENKQSFLDKIIFHMRFHQIIPSIPADTDITVDFGSGYRADGLQYLISKKLTKRGIGLDLSVCKDEKFENIELFEADFESGTSVLSDNTADIALSLAVLEHLHNPEKYLRDIFRVLKPGGKLLLTTPSPHSKPILEFLAHQLKLIDKNEIDDHKHYFTLQELEDLAKKVGFSTYKAKYFELGVNDFLSATK